MHHAGVSLCSCMSTSVKLTVPMLWTCHCRFPDCDTFSLQSVVISRLLTTLHGILVGPSQLVRMNTVSRQNERGIPNLRYTLTIHNYTYNQTNNSYACPKSQKVIIISPAQTDSTPGNHYLTYQPSLAAWNPLQC